MEPAIGADERAFRGHTERPDFQIGEAKEQWRLVGGGIRRLHLNGCVV